MENTIYFFKIKEPYGCFSNFAPYSIQEGGLLWLTSEHYYQAWKFLDYETRERIRLMPKPGDAAREGRRRDLPLREDWEEIKVSVMLQAVLFKFEQHEDIKQILLGTGDARIVERTDRDSYWGDGPDGKGRNMLGQVLQIVRAHLRG
jgi:ribA/ribD-fused uncharacterized protein